MSTHRPPRHWGTALQDASRVQRTGGERFTRSAAPVPAVQEAVRRAQIAAVGVTDRASKIDQFTLAGGGAQDLALTYLPLLDSENVSIRSLVCLLTDDYTISGQTLSLTTGKAPLTGDKVQIQYDYLTGVSAELPSTGAWLFASSSGTFAQPSLPAGAAAGDLAVLFIAHDTANTLTANGWTSRGTAQVTHAAHSNTYTYEQAVYTKTLVGGDTMPAIAFINNQANVNIVAVCQGGGTYNSIASTVTSNSVSASSPAAASGTVAVRGWMALSDLGVITAPGRPDIDQTADVGGADVDGLVFVENDLTSVSATIDQIAGWVAHTVGVTP